MRARTGRPMVCACLLAAALQVPLLAAFPTATGYVNDFANLLGPQSRTELESLLRATEQETSAEIVLVTVSTLDGLSVEEYANKLFQEWGIGKKRENNGVLVLVAPSDRSMRIEVGYGLEPVIPDGLAGDIIRTDFLPHFRNNDYPRGIDQGLQRVVALVKRHEAYAPVETIELSSQAVRNPAWYLMLPFFALFVGPGFFALGYGLRQRAGFLLVWGAFFGGAPLMMALGATGGLSLTVLGPLAAGAFIFGFRKGGGAPWLESMRGSSGSGWVGGASSSTSSSSSFSGHSGSSSSSSSSSGGNFGGGRSGGGGASGKW